MSKGKSILSIVCIVLGGFVMLIAFDIIESEPGSKHAPDFVIAICGFVFIVAGAMVMLGQKSRLNDLLAAVFCLAFGIVAVWASMFSDDEGFSGGLPFVSYETNVVIARFVFGFGALVCFAMSTWALKRFFRSSE